MGATERLVMHHYVGDLVLLSVDACLLRISGTLDGRFILYFASFAFKFLHSSGNIM
jgi:hypothetical protein